MNPEWQGGKKDERLYRKVRTEKQQVIRQKDDLLKGHLNERGRRLWAASEAISFGPGGIRAVSEALEMSPKTVIQGRRELQGESPDERGGRVVTRGRQRRPGGGRKPAVEQQPGLLEAIEAIVNPATRGDPMKPLKWTSKSLRKISAERQGWRGSAKTVAEILREQLHYSLQGLQKPREGTSHPDRDAQFQYLNRQCQEFQQRGQPVISVDTKKKERVGDFKNGGREWQPAGKPEPVRMHDFEDKQLGKGIPYGVFDQGRNEGWVSVGIHHDTAEFAVASIH